jgi:hypothetical protein
MGGIGAATKAITTSAQSNRNQVGRFRPANDRAPFEKNTKQMVKFGKKVREKVVKGSERVAKGAGRIAQDGFEKGQKVAMAAGAMYGVASLGID